MSCISGQCAYSGAATPPPAAPTASVDPAQFTPTAQLGGPAPTGTRVDEMTAKLNAAPDFDAKNAIFHEYFDAVPETDVATRQGFFFAFMGAIAKPDADRVMEFLRKMEENTAQAQPAGAATPAPASTAPPGILVIGDSLSVGTKQYLNEGMAGQPVEVNATSGIQLAEGMKRYNATAVKPRVVEMALFTNNSPNQIEELRAAVNQTVADARQRGGKVIWATIVRPGGYEAVNQLLRDAAARNPDVMGLVDWEGMVKSNPSYLAGDKIHGTPEGYKARAQAFADAGR